MKRLFIFLLFCFISAAGLVAVGHIGGEQDVVHDSLLPTVQGYVITVPDEKQISNINPPELPEISDFTAESVYQSMPQTEAGIANVTLLETSYKKAGKDIPFYGERQQRLDPLVIVIESGVYDLPMLEKTVDNPDYFYRDEAGHYTARLPIIVNEKATLLINDKSVLRLSKTDASFIASFGTLFVAGAMIEGWDLEKNTPAVFQDDDHFRPYIVAWCGSQMTFVDSSFAYLGYFNSKSYGITYTSCSDTLYADDYPDAPGATGMLINNVFKDIYYGFYSYETSDIKILHNRYIDNVVYGIDPHDRSTNLIIAHNHVTGSKQKHGIIISRDVDDSYIFNNISEGNAGTGLMLDRQCSNNVIAYNILRRNGGDGMAFYESPNNFSYKNVMAGNQGRGLRVRNSLSVTSLNDVVNDNEKGGIQLYSADLESQGHDRDVNLDPYAQQVELTVLGAEMIGNARANFTLDDVTHLTLFGIKGFNMPKSFMTGDVEIKALPDAGVTIRKAD